MHTITPSLSLKYDTNEKNLQCIRLRFEFSKNHKILLPPAGKSYCSFTAQNPKAEAVYKKSVTYQFYEYVKDGSSMLHRACFLLPCKYTNDSYTKTQNALMEFNLTFLLKEVYNAGFLLNVDEMQTQANSVLETIKPEWIDCINKCIEDYNKSTYNTLNDEDKKKGQAKPITIQGLSEDILEVVKMIPALQEKVSKKKDSKPNLYTLEDAQIKAIASDLIKS